MVGTVSVEYLALIFEVLMGEYEFLIGDYGVFIGEYPVLARCERIVCKYSVTTGKKVT